MSDEECELLEEGGVSKPSSSIREQDNEDANNDTLCMVVEALQKEQARCGGDTDVNTCSSSASSRQETEDQEEVKEACKGKPLKGAGLETHEGFVDESFPGAFAMAPPSPPREDSGADRDLEVAAAPPALETTTTTATVVSTAGEHLLEAMPVDDEVVMAEQMTNNDDDDDDDDARHNKDRKDYQKLVTRLRIVGPIFLLLLVAVTVGLVVTASSKNTQGQDYIQATTAAQDPEQNQEETSITEGTTPHQEEGALTTTTQVHVHHSEDDSLCFSSRDELVAAVDAFANNDNSSLGHNNHYGWPIGSWCVSQVQDFYEVFAEPRNVKLWNFSEPIGDWDMTGASGNIRGMFRGGKNLSGQLGIQQWNTSSFTTLDFFFQSAHWSGPIDLSSWDTSKVTSMKELFRKNKHFTHVTGVEYWDTSRVRTMSHLAQATVDFNANISLWNTSLVEEIHNAFHRATSFNQDLSAWQTSSLKLADNAFQNASSFNSPMDSWDVSNLRGARNMFRDAANFNQPLGSWNVSRLVRATNMFKSASSFSQDLCSWRFLLPESADLKNMFVGTNCPNTSDPVHPHEGPFCFNCEDHQ
ncbi:protein kinase kinase kinase [Seminavis robusta]|uniref:Protein kinase kinase kinase n=1 Tax=Seminavis robusta TaxID=568900 RepID=A0A9N8HX49_9STRA|nr:protein kinase kinase kinase [Seminavis robusta]|eukprot:Sro2360_g324740.1 protein kinase kinase kinase (584) ;mRNA; r:6482-8233